MAQQVLDSLEQWIVGSMPKHKQLRQREKHFNTVMAGLVCLVLSTVPLYGGTVASSEPTSTVTFRSVGTWMHLGTQPFVFASFVHSKCQRCHWSDAVKANPCSSAKATIVSAMAFSLVFSTSDPRAMLVNQLK